MRVRPHAAERLLLLTTAMAHRASAIGYVGPPDALFPGIHAGGVGAHEGECGSVELGDIYHCELVSSPPYRGLARPHLRFLRLHHGVLEVQDPRRSLARPHLRFLRLRLPHGAALPLCAPWWVQDPASWQVFGYGLLCPYWAAFWNRSLPCSQSRYMMWPAKIFWANGKFRTCRAAKNAL